MKKRMIARLTAVALGGLLVLAPLASNASDSAAKARPACVKIRSGNLNIQLGYAPNGPRGCTRLP
jgi:hypothetical protein